MREDTSYRTAVDKLIIVPDGADARDTEAVNRIATAYLKLLFPNIRKPEDIKPRDFNRYCLRRACNMRATIKMKLGIMDTEYLGYPVAYLMPTKAGVITPESLRNMITDNMRLRVNYVCQK